MKMEELTQQHTFIIDNLSKPDVHHLQISSLPLQQPSTHHISRSFLTHNLNLKEQMSKLVPQPGKE
jgi:hypothetical protein